VTSIPGEREASGITIRKAGAGDAQTLARIMDAEIPWGRLRDLGPGFLTILHRAFCTSRHAVCLVAEVDKTVVGYCAAAVHLGRFHNEFILRHGVVAGLAALPRLLRWSQLKILWKGLSYRSDPRPDEPQSEIALLAVDAAFKGRGIGAGLVEATMSHLRDRGVDAVRVGTVTEGNVAAIAVYRRYGFRIVRTAPFYGDSKVHVMEYRFDRS
jgi:ribosomal protein S18 acetylase RimI-like enzyme